MKVGDIVSLHFNGLQGIILSEPNGYGWHKILDFEGNKWEVSGVLLEIYCEGG